MAARSTRITIRNRSDMQFIVSGVGTGLEGGVWSDGGRPEAGTLLLETMDLTIQSESSGFATGTTGTIVMTTTIPGIGPFEFSWDNPFVGGNEYFIKQTPGGLDAFYEGGEGDDAVVVVTIRPTAEVRTLFRPSVSGWKFSNTTWPSVPNTEINLGLFSIPIGDASNGMCGGMVYSAVDYFLSGQAIPPLTTNPPALGDPYFNYISSRLYDSFHLPGGPLSTYITYMATGYPPASRAMVTLKEAIPRIRGDIAAGWPSPIGLIGVISDSIIADLGKHHQVLAWSYRRDGQWITLGIYDPNRPGRDDLQITIDGSSLGPVSLIHNTSMGDIFMLFHTGYTFNTPPALV
jgi:hypothetical protein